MPLEILALTVAANLAFVLASVPAGEGVLLLAERILARARGQGRSPEMSLPRLAAASLAGFGILAYVGLALGLVHAFTWWMLVLAGLGIALAGRRTLARYGRYVASRAQTARDLLRDRFVLAGLLVAAALFLANYQAALAPPTVTDELVYHLPEADVVVESRTFSLNPESIYPGNLPKLFEILHAEAIAVSGDYALARVLQLTIVGIFLVFLFGSVRTFFGDRAGALAVVLVLWLEEFMRNAPSAYVDAATTSLEVAGVVAAAAWVQRGRVADAAASTVLVGLALGGKYTPAFSLIAALSVVVGTATARRWPLRRVLAFGTAFAAIAAVLCGFWYVKNLVLRGNPVFPFLFGHEGISQQTYEELLAAIRQFGPRTPDAFLRLPQRFATLAGATAFLAFCLLPFSVAIRRTRLFVAILALYVLAYAAYWFFLASHQERFLSPALIAGVVLASIVLTTVALPLRLAAAATAVAIFVVAAPTGAFSPSIVWDTAVLKLRAFNEAASLRYVLGFRRRTST